MGDIWEAKLSLSFSEAILRFVYGQLKREKEREREREREGEGGRERKREIDYCDLYNIFSI